MASAVDCNRIAAIKEYKLQRRKFVKSLSIALINTMFCPLRSTQAAEQKTKKTKQFEVKDSDTLLVQSGVFGSNLFVIGVLRCSNPEAVNKRIQAARQKSKYQCVLTHRSRNKYKAAYLDYLLTDWLKNDDLKIQLRIVRPPKASEKPLTGAAWTRAYADELSSSLAKDGGVPVQGGRILTQPRFKGKQQSELENMLFARNDRIKSVEKVSAKDCELMQFLMTVTGIVRASEDASLPLEARSKTKVKTIALLKYKLKTQDFKKPQQTKQFEITVI